MRLKQQALSGVKWTSLSTVSVTILHLFKSVIIAHFLAPDDFGLMGMTMVVVGFAQAYTDFGISAAIIHRQDITKEQLSSLYWLNVIAGLLVFVLAWLSIPLVVMFFKEPRLSPLLQVVSFVFIIAALGKQFEVLLQKELLFNILARQEIIAALSSFFVTITCAISGFGVWSLLWGLITEISCKTLLLIRIGLSTFRPSFHFRPSDLKGFIGFGLFQTGERTVNFLSERLDQILIGNLLGAKALGFYYFAFRLVLQPISRINPVITKVAFPVFSKVQHDNERLRKGYIKVINFLTTINAPLLIGLAAVAPIAVPFIFGTKWAESVILIQVLSFVALLRSTGNPIGSLQLAKGHADLGFKWNVFLLIVTIPTLYAGGILGKGLGVAISLLLLQIVLQIPGYFYMIRPLIGKCAKEYTIAILKPIAMAGIMGLTIISMSHLLNISASIVELITQIGVGILTYLLFVWLFDKNVIYELRSIIFSRSDRIQ